MKSKELYICKSCGNQSAKWLGKCPNCGEWDTFVKEVSEVSKKSRPASHSNNKIYRLDEIETENNYRIKTCISELDRVLGGGIIPGSLILMGGDPGIGKSTMMLQMCSTLGDYEPLYVTGEESLQQIKYRANRLAGNTENLFLLAETNIESIIQAIKSVNSMVVVIDSIQSVYSERVDATPGSIIQVRECASALMQVAKTTGKAIFIIGHVTKDGFIAGPKILEHLVDAVLQFEGDKSYSFRILRALKNRFGSTNELGIFEMSNEGLSEVTNPSEIFLANRMQDASGVAIVAAIEGSRPILLEVQALVSPTSYSVPQRTSNGFDLRRLQMILAVLDKRLGIPFWKHDVFINVAGGIYLNDPSVDLGIAAALVSSFRDESLSSQTVIIGEIGLTGEVRMVSSIEQRIAESEKLGFKNVIIPKNNFKNNTKYNIKLTEVERISLALTHLFV